MSVTLSTLFRVAVGGTRSRYTEESPRRLDPPHSLEDDLREPRPLGLDTVCLRCDGQLRCHPKLVVYPEDGVTVGVSTDLQLYYPRKEIRTLTEKKHQ